MLLIQVSEFTADQLATAGSWRSWVEFTATEDTGIGGIYIPTVTVDGDGNKVFGFNIKVEEGQKPIRSIRMWRLDMTTGRVWVIPASHPLYCRTSVTADTTCSCSTMPVSRLIHTSDLHAGEVFRQLIFSNSARSALALKAFRSSGFEE